MKFAVSALVSSSLLLAAGAVFAQDASLAPNFGTVTLSAGFTPDPTEVSVVAGGPVQVSRAGCTGYVSNSPDVDIAYTAGSWPLNIYYIGSGDSTLYIVAPDGQVYCNDDTNGFNPAVNIPSPVSGVYSVFVGTYSSDGGVTGTLKISEISPQW